MNLRRILWMTLLLGLTTGAVGAQSNVTVRVMAANITSGNGQSYETAGINIFQGLQPDIVAIQEFRYGSGSTASQLRTLVDTAFGTNFNFFCESGYNIPNGIVSRYPILAAGSWDDALISDRGFAWAQIDLPGTNDLYVVSVHLYSSGSATDRNTEATEIKNYIQANFPANAWVIVAGDFNTSSRGEACVSTFKTFLSDDPIPTDNNLNPNTSEPRSKPYDYVLPSLSLVSRLVPSVIGAQSFNGLVFDSAVFTPLSAVAPVAAGDSHTLNMQHMAVIKDFSITVEGGGVTNPPAITAQPQSLSVPAGQSATFGVTATGTAPLAYQWCFNGTNLAGATTNPFTLLAVQATNAGNYSVVITNVAGSVTSAVAGLTLTVQDTNPPATNLLVIARWNFNSLVPDNATATGVTTPAIGSGAASLVGGATATFATGDPVLDPAGSTDNSGWNTATYPAQGVGNKSCGAQFAVSTVGKQNIVLSWSSESPSTGSKYGRLEYATNGTDFVGVATAFTNGTTFTAKTNSLAGMPGVANNPNFAFRFVSEFESTALGTANANYVAGDTAKTYGSGGTMRYDLVTISGTAIVTNGTASAPVFSAPTMTSGQLQFTVSGTPGASYIIQAATNLAAPDWQPVWTNVAPFSFGETNPGAPQKFYRALPQ